MLDRGNEIGIRQRRPLRIRDGNQRDVRKAVVNRPQFRQIEPPVQRRHMRSIRQAPHDREVKRRDVEVNDVELARPRGDLFHHPEVRRQLIAACAQSQCLAARSDESG